jgi:hypothetical protein
VRVGHCNLFPNSSECIDLSFGAWWLRCEASHAFGPSSELRPRSGSDHMVVLGVCAEQLAPVAAICDRGYKEPPRHLGARCIDGRSRTSNSCHML